MARPSVTQYVGPTELRRRFNQGRYVERAGSGELAERLLADRHPSQPLANEPFCTRSQMVSYRDQNGRELAQAHRYLRPDGTIGLGGRPDPKALRDGDVLYIVLPDLDRRR